MASGDPPEMNPSPFRRGWTGFRAWVARGFEIPAGFDPRFSRTYVAFRVACVAAIVNNLITVVQCQVGPLARYAPLFVVSVLVWALAMVLQKRGRVRLAMSFGFLEVIYSSSLQVVLYGFDAGNVFYLFIIPLAVFLLPKHVRFFQWTWTALSFLAIVAQFLVFRSLTGDRGLKGDEMVFTYVINAGFVVTVLGIIANYFRNLADQFEERATLHDKITGLPNRAHALDRLAELAARSRREKKGFALLLVDLDDFRALNERMGDGKGDRILAEASQRLRNTARREDFVSRLEGDRFLILVPSTEDGGEATSMVERLRASLRAPFAVGELEDGITMSVGVAFFPGDAQQVGELLAAAEQALGRAKQAKPNGLRLFDKGMDEETRKTRVIVDQLRHSLHQGGFRLAYQPKVHPDGRLASFEALLRWTSPTFGPVSPGVFIPLLEKAGLIGEIGDWIIGEAFRRQQDLLGRGLHARPIAVNVSVVQCQDPDFARRTLARLHATGLSPDLFEIEITESVFATAYESLKAVLTTFREAGLRSAVDDFGTGYSSLMRIAELPVDVIKIDKSFVDRIGQSAATENVIRWIVQMSKSMGRHTVAEGIEHRLQADFLEGNGVDLFQGYLFGRPLEAEAADRLLGQALG